MGKVNQHHFPERGDYQNWVDEGPDQEAPGFDTVTCVLSHLVDATSVVLILACGFVWAGILSGRI